MPEGRCRADASLLVRRHRPRPSAVLVRVGCGAWEQPARAGQTSRWALGAAGGRTGHPDGGAPRLRARRGLQAPVVALSRRPIGDRPAGGGGPGGGRIGTSKLEPVSYTHLTLPTNREV